MKLGEQGRGMQEHASTMQAAPYGVYSPNPAALMTAVLGTTPRCSPEQGGKETIAV